MKKLLLVGLMMLSSFITFSQVSGTVLDSETKSPLLGLTVLVQGIYNGVVTDFDGNFSLETQLLEVSVVSYLGYEISEVNL